MYAVRILLMVASVSHVVSFRWGFCPQPKRSQDSLPERIPGVLEFNQQNIKTVRTPVGDTFTVNCTTNDPNAEVSLTKYLGPSALLRMRVDNRKIFLEKQVFSVADVKLHEFGCYTCNAKIKNGEKVHRIQQTMTHVLFLQDMKRPEIIDGPQHTLVYGSSANFTCSGQKFYKLQWVRWYSSTHQEPVDDSMTETVDVGKRRQGVLLKIKDLREPWDQPVLYTCVISHKKKQLSATLSITIQEPKPPRDIDFNGHMMITCPGSTFTVTCKAFGTPRPSITFHRNSQEIRSCKDTSTCDVEGENYRIKNHNPRTNEESRKELKIVNATKSNTGMITCRADNGFGEPLTASMMIFIMDKNSRLFPGIPAGMLQGCDNPR